MDAKHKKSLSPCWGLQYAYLPTSPTGTRKDAIGMGRPWDQSSWPGDLETGSDNERMPRASASENRKSIFMLRNMKDRGGEARGGTAGGWRDEMIADDGRLWQNG